jgi:membrane protease YdiL (CAAX protease family)
MLYTIISFIITLQNLLDIPTGSPSLSNPLYDLTFFSYGPIVEEFGFRMTIIGFAIIIIMRNKGISFDFVKAIWKPSNYINQIGSGKNIIIGSLVLASSIFFGLAHIIYGGGVWEIGKFPTATLAGVFMSLIYIYYGFHAAVLLHWAFNYPDIAFYYFGNMTKIYYLIDILDISLIIFGTITFVLLSSKIYQKLFNLFNSKKLK